MLKFPAAIAAAVLIASMVTHAQVTSISDADNETTDRWFVELSSAPGVDGTGIAALEREEASFHAAAAAAEIRYRERKHFRDLFNGLTVRATGHDAAKLRSLPGVRAVYPDVKVSLSQQEVPPGNAAELITALAQTGADVAQSALGLTGRGVRVAVIDTGLDYDHPDLGGAFGPGAGSPKGSTSSATPSTRTTRSPSSAGSRSGRLRRPRHPRLGHHRRQRRAHGCGPRRDLPRLSRLRLRRDDDLRHHARSHGARPPGRRRCGEHEHRRGASVAAVPDRAGGEPPRPPRHRCRRVDRQRRHARPVCASAPGVGKDVIGVASFDNTHTNFIVSRVA